MNNKGLASIVSILIIAVIIAAIGGYIFYLGRSVLPQKQIACTMDVKICPDGTSVGRSGPKCEFTSCPSSKAEDIANWKTYTIQKIDFSMQYPSDWQLVEKKYDASNQEVIFSGSEGKISFKMGTGFGGGCPIPMKVKITGQELPACQTEDGQIISFEKETNSPLDLGDGVVGRLSIKVDANIILPIQVNQNMILKILSTFKFLDSQSIEISKEEAVMKVRDSPKVQDYLKIVPKGIVEFDHEDKPKNEWVIHVYEIVRDHTATMNWYYVNKKTGEIKDFFDSPQ